MALLLTHRRYDQKGVSKTSKTTKMESKREKLARIGAEIYSLKKTNGKHFDTTSHLCSVINILAKGTRFEIEAKSIIKSVDANYFNDDPRQP